MEHGHSTFVPRLYRVVITCISVCTACKRGRPRYRRASPAIRTRNSRRRLFRGHTTGKPRVSQFCTFSTTGNRGQKKIAKFYPRYRRERLCDRALIYYCRTIAWRPITFEYQTFNEYKQCSPPPFFCSSSSFSLSLSLSFTPSLPLLLSI